MRVTRLALSACWIVLALMFGVMDTHAQSTVSGLVTNEDGVPVDGATVRFTALSGPEVVTAVTNSLGAYSVFLSNAGYHRPYGMVVEADGFISREISTVDLGGDVPRVDFRLVTKASTAKSSRQVVTPFGPEVDGVRARARASESVAQGDVFKIKLELDVSTRRLPTGRNRIGDLPDARPALELVGDDGKIHQIVMSDSARGLPVVRDPSSTAREFASSEARSIALSFPLVQAWDALKPGSFKARVSVTYASSRADMWEGTLITPTFNLRLTSSKPREERYLLPKALRVEDKCALPMQLRCVVYHNADAEEVRLSIRHGFVVGAQITSSQGRMLYTGVPRPGVGNQIDSTHKTGHNFADDYTIVIFETTDMPGYGWPPGPGSGSYRELWRRTISPK